MKSNQERSNECLPPKKRSASTLPSEERPVVVAPANESQRSGNLTWLASLAGGHEKGRPNTSTSLEPDGPQYKPMTVPSESTASHPARAPTAVTTMSAMNTSSLSQPPGTIQYTPLPPNLHFISSPYSTPYAGYISPLVPPPGAPNTTQRETYAGSSGSPVSKVDLHPHHLSRPPGLATTDNTSSHHSTQYVQIAGSTLSTPARTAPSSHAHLPPHLHAHHTLPLTGPSQLLVQYSDGPKREESRTRELLNGELEKDRRFGPSPESNAGKLSSTKGRSSTPQHQINQQQSSHLYDARHLVLPAEYVQDISAMRTSLVLVPNNHSSGAGDSGGTMDKLPPPVSHSDKGGICSGRPVSRTSTSASHPFPPPPPPPPPPTDSLKGAITTLAHHAVIQTTQNTTDSLSLGLTSANFYNAQQSIIGYIAGSGHQQPVSYHTSLPQHLVIPGTQPVIIPVSGAEPTSTSTTSPLPATLSHTFVTSMAPKVESFEAPAPYSHPALVQAQLHLPVVPAPGLLTSPPLPSAPSLPPYFTKGSIIQLADGELKRVEDLKTDDFIQSAEISSELKIDSSTVERIENSHTPNFAIIQFAVGEHRSQVSVEVLVEYPFFVFGQGWSSCCPDRTTQLLELPCTKLSVGDVCISLTLKNIRNGSIKKSQALDAHTLDPPFKSPKSLLCGQRGVVRHTERENGLEQGWDQESGGNRGNRENGELRCSNRDKAQTEPEPDSKPTGRKRRWSAPEGRKAENPDGEPPLKFPKPSFIPQEVKISIEGRSNFGK